MVNAMVSAFSGSSPAYTVVGSGRRQAATGLCAVLLNRGGGYARASCFKELENAGFDYVLSLEKAGERYDIEELGAQFPFVRFVLFKEMPGVGERINIAAAEADTPLFFVLWNDFHPVLGLNAERVAEKLLGGGDGGTTPAANGNGAAGGGAGRRVCTVPIFQSPQFETFPCAAAPFVNGKKFETILFAPQKEGEPSLYPFDGAGVYDRERFLGIGGFDAGFADAYWQLMDFGLRSWLWGCEIRCSQHLRFRLNGAVNATGIAAGKSYLRFFLKNLAPDIRPHTAEAGGVTGEANAHLPLKRFLPYLSASGGKPLSAMRDFAEARAWVRMNSARFVRSVDEAARLWVDG